MISPQKWMILTPLQKCLTMQVIWVKLLLPPALNGCPKCKNCPIWSHWLESTSKLLLLDLFSRWNSLSDLEHSFLKTAIPGLLYLFSSFQCSWQKSIIIKNFADDGIRAADLWFGNDFFANWVTTTAHHQTLLYNTCSVTRKNRQISIKVISLEKMIDFNTFTKIA